MAIVVAAMLALPLEAQKGKGGGNKGGGNKSAGKSAGTSNLPDPESKRLPAGERSPARQFEHPKSGNSLPQEVRDKLPPGLRDRPENHPGLANHLRKMGLLKDYPAVDPVPPEVRRQLPTGLRELPYDHPGVANYLGRLGWSIDEDGALVPPPTVLTPVLTPPVLTSPLLSAPLLSPPLTPPLLTSPLLAPPLVTPSTEGAILPRSFGPFAGFFRRR